jgi:hypothetical protein
MAESICVGNRPKPVQTADVIPHSASPIPTVVTSSISLDPRPGFSADITTCRPWLPGLPACLPSLACKFWRYNLCYLCLQNIRTKQVRTYRDSRRWVPPLSNSVILRTGFLPGLSLACGCTPSQGRYQWLGIQSTLLLPYPQISLLMRAKYLDQMAATPERECEFDRYLSPNNAAGGFRFGIQGGVVVPDHRVTRR